MGEHAPKQWPERAKASEPTAEPLTETSHPVDDTIAPPAEKIDATDAARELAAERDVDLAAVTGTGADGRITKDDVQSFVDQPG